ncbi:hypothetical protein IFM89_002277 [Coptis chinensis]|uniref:INO80 complex subunit B-like conserved region domain-containing protein n=1 Tax=Coptis chinensis TaxID=261450 RepID=A0A835ILB9_9MAGN|nr:hypothetical protein IFM89_002277 [Coptis chinensis]
MSIKKSFYEVEQQLKKAEAAQRRRVQVAKAAKESEAIRKILGQDSNRKKREDKLKKRRDELAQPFVYAINIFLTTEKVANARTLPPNTIRWVIRPLGTDDRYILEKMLAYQVLSSKPCR